MASSLSRWARRALLSHAAASPSSRVQSRFFSASSPASARRTRSKLEEDLDTDELMEYIEEPESNDSPTMSHLILQERRMVRYYLRLIEHEMPHLAGTCIFLFLQCVLINGFD
jgi:hypothetical protein